MTIFDDQLAKVRKEKGFIAALDQSGGSTPKALELYGVPRTAYANDDEMFDRVHAMRTRIVTSRVFDGRRILGAILFENTLDRDIAGQNSAAYLWNEKQIVPFLKVDKGLDAEADGVQVMKPMPNLAALLDKAKGRNVFGTKMRSVVKHASAGGISKVVDQQFEIGRRIVDAGLVPIIEPEIDIHAPDKAEAEALLLRELTSHLDALPAGRFVMLKLTLPEQADLYAPCVAHPNVARVVALSGGYSREEANRRLALNHGVVASFSRALTEGLSASQSDAEFDRTLDAAIESIFQASST
ncbi:MAG: fructose bisphosphate aldolase [Spirochaetaceae bacterium]|nr:fructose bisphosphate aldolase [Spirochaetaceae bacterium]